MKYALDINSEEIRFIDQVHRGLACNCKCAECGELLEAAQGKVNDWHFRHSNNKNCKGAQETLIHKLAKQILFEGRDINLPKGRQAYLNPVLEKDFGAITPDVTSYIGDRLFFIEVRVTHPLEQKNEDIYISGNHNCVEIDLCTISREISPETLKEIVVDFAENKRIVSWERLVTPKTTVSPLGILLAIVGVSTLIISFLRKRGKW